MLAKHETLSLPECDCKTLALGSLPMSHWIDFKIEFKDKLSNKYFVLTYTYFFRSLTYSIIKYDVVKQK